MPDKPTPSHTIRVFGSAVLRIAPDLASIVVAVSRVDPKAEDAFAAARHGAQGVTTYLHGAGMREFGSSRVTLVQETRYIDGQTRFLGYKARIAFNLVLRDLDRLETILSGLLSAGANELESVSFQTIRLRELRAETRQRAVAAARSKADVYCQAAGVRLGAVLTIEDLNPEQVRGHGESYAHTEPEAEETSEPGAIDPGSIIVTGAVRMTYAIEA